MATVATTETKELEVTKLINETVDLIKENCQIALDDVKSARETGSKNAQEIAEKFQFKRPLHNREICSSSRRNLINLRILLQ